MNESCDLLSVSLLPRRDAHIILCVKRASYSLLLRAVAAYILYMGSAFLTAAAWGITHESHQRHRPKLPSLPPLLRLSGGQFGLRKHDCAEEAAELFDNMRVPAALVAGAIVPLVSFAGPRLDLSDSSSMTFAKQLHFFVAMVSLLSALVAVMYATVSFNSLTEVNLQRFKPCFTALQSFRIPVCSSLTDDRRTRLLQRLSRRFLNAIMSSHGLVATCVFTSASLA